MPVCFTDILGVVLVEHVLGLTDSIYTLPKAGMCGVVGKRRTRRRNGRRVAGGAAAEAFPKDTGPVLTARRHHRAHLFLTWYMGRAGMYCEVDIAARPSNGASAHGWRIFGHSRYCS